MIGLPERPDCLTLNPVYEWYFSDRQKVVEYVKSLEEKHHGTYTEEKSSTDRICWHCGGAGEKVRIGEKCLESSSGICHDGCEHMLFPFKDDPSDDYNEGFIDGALRVEEFWNSTCKTCGGKFAPKELPIKDLGDEGD